MIANVLREPQDVLARMRSVRYCAQSVAVLDPEIDAAYPARWIGKVSVATTDGRQLAARVDEPKGDPGNTLSRDEIDAKARRLASYRGAVGNEELGALMDRL